MHLKIKKEIDLYKGKLWQIVEKRDKVWSGKFVKWKLVFAGI